MELELIVRTPDPERLLDEIYDLIDRQGVGGWDYDEDGNLFATPAHSAIRFGSSLERDELRWTVLQLGDLPTDRTAVTICLGQLVASLLSTFDHRIREIVIV